MLFYHGARTTNYLDVGGQIHRLRRLHGLGKKRQEGKEGGGQKSDGRWQRAEDRGRRTPRLNSQRAPVQLGKEDRKKKDERPTSNIEHPTSNEKQKK